MIKYKIVSETLVCYTNYLSMSLMADVCIRGHGNFDFLTFAFGNLHPMFLFYLKVSNCIITHNKYL